MVRFTAAAAADYDQRIPRFVPGYALAAELAAAELRDALPETAHILVVGAGTGVELVRLAQWAPSWRFTAIDPSEGMLEAARLKVDTEGIADRVTFAVTSAEDFATATRFDGAVSILVGHFMPDDGARTRFVAAIAQMLKPKGLYLTVDTAAPENPGHANGIYQRWAVLTGLEDREAAAMTTRVRTQHHGITATRLSEIFAEAGLEPPQLFFKALAYEGYAARLR